MPGDDQRRVLNLKPQDDKTGVALCQVALTDAVAALANSLHIGTALEADGRPEGVFHETKAEGLGWQHRHSSTAGTASDFGAGRSNLAIAPHAAICVGVGIAFGVVPSVSVTPPKGGCDMTSVWGGVMILE